MSKKDFIKIALILKANKPDEFVNMNQIEFTEFKQSFKLWNSIVQDFSKHLQSVNPNFSKTKFLEFLNL